MEAVVRRDERSSEMAGISKQILLRDENLMNQTNLQSRAETTKRLLTPANARQRKPCPFAGSNPVEKRQEQGKAQAEQLKCAWQAIRGASILLNH